MAKSIPIPINPEVLKWARERAGYNLDNKIAGIEPDIIKGWEAGQSQPTLARLQKLAEKYHRPAGFFWLDKPPDEPELTDFRAGDGQEPSPIVQAYIFQVEARCEWAAEFRQEQGETPPGKAFIGRATREEKPADIARRIRRALRVRSTDLFAFAGDNKTDSGGHSAALQYWIDRVEKLGIFVFENDTAGKKRIGTDQLRGLAVSDPYAPAVALNKKDARRGKIFTLAHELAHLWISAPGISNFDPVRMARSQIQAVERFCNEIAAEILMPETDFLDAWRTTLADTEDKSSVVRALARRFHVSDTAAAIKARMLRKINPELCEKIRYENRKEWEDYLADKPFRRSPPRGKVLGQRAGRLFSQMLLSAYHGGEINPTVARKLLGAKTFKQVDAIAEYWHSQGVSV